jgi:hypothetical protein
MAPVLPRTREDTVAWFAARLGDWAKAGSSIGIDSGQIMELTTRLAEAQTALDDAEAARIASKNATVEFHWRYDRLRKYGADLIKVIKAFAETNEDARVYTAASIPLPGPPTPLGPPQTPVNLTATLNTAGAIKLEWEASRRGGTSFAVERSLTGSGRPWTLIGVSETKSFTDGHVPTGLAEIAYRVTAARSGGASVPTAPLVVLFGTETNEQAPALTVAA